MYKHKTIRKVTAAFLSKEAGKKNTYHGTSSKHSRKILKKGLAPAGSKEVNIVYNDDSSMGSRSTKTFGGVYLAAKIEDALDYATEAAEGSLWGVPQESFLLL